MWGGGPVLIWGTAWRLFGGSWHGTAGPAKGCQQHVTDTSPVQCNCSQLAYALWSTCFGISEPSPGRHQTRQISAVFGFSLIMAQKGRNMLQQYMSADCQCILLVPVWWTVNLADTATKCSAVEFRRVVTNSAKTLRFLTAGTEWGQLIKWEETSSSAAHRAALGPVAKRLLPRHVCPYQFRGHNCHLCMNLLNKLTVWRLSEISVQCSPICERELLFGRFPGFAHLPFWWEQHVD